jgi:GntR family transcriptional regulator / MocR family aminotransferase
VADSGTRSSAAEILVELDRASRVPLRTQLEHALRRRIRSGALRAGATLPSSRLLAADLGVSRRLVVEAYTQLAAEGYLTTEQRSTTRVADVGAGRPADDRRAVLPAPPRHDLRPSVPALAEFPRAAWLRAGAAAIRAAPDRAFDYPDPIGASALRTSLADYLRRVRAVDAEPERVLVCAGFTQALSLLVGVMDHPLVALEDPGLVGRDRIIAAAGGTHLPIGVDRDGLQVERLAESNAAAVITTPTHQFPLGVALASGRRARLLDWAHGGHLIIEDDYDAEFRYDRKPVGALQGLAPEHVAYIGTTSKTLAPALRLGWLVAPAALVEPLAELRWNRDAGGPTLDQLTLAELIDSGAYERHLRRVRRRYRDRRDRLVAALRRHLPAARVTGMAAGLHLVAHIPGAHDTTRIVRAAASLGLAVVALDRYRLDRTDATGETRLVLGYGNITADAVDTAVQRLSEAVATKSGR